MQLMHVLEDNTTGKTLLEKTASVDKLCGSGLQRSLFCGWQRRLVIAQNFARANQACLCPARTVPARLRDLLSAAGVRAPACIYVY